MSLNAGPTHLVFWTRGPDFGFILKGFFYRVRLDVLPLAAHQKRYLRGVLNIDSAPEVGIIAACDIKINSIAALVVFTGIGNDDKMRRACIDRHTMAVNIAFLDFSVHKVRIINLRNLSWHRNWNTDLSIRFPPKVAENTWKIRIIQLIGLKMSF